MELVKRLTIASIIIIFVALISIGIFQLIETDLHNKYRYVYQHHNPWYWPKRRRHRKKHCPFGCTIHKTCPYGNLCYNCKGNNPMCCCYDSQCQGCSKKI